MTASIRLAEAIRRPAFWILFYVMFCYSLVQLGIADHLVLYLMDLGYTKEVAGNALGLAVGAGIVAKVGAGAILLRVRARTALLVNTGVLAASLVLMPFAGDERLLRLFGLLFGLSTAARDVFLPMTLADAFGARYFAQIYGIVMLAFIPGAVLGPIVLARIHDLIGDYRPGFSAGVALLLAAFVALIALPRSSAAPDSPARGVDSAGR